MADLFDLGRRALDGADKAKNLGKRAKDTLPAPKPSETPKETPKKDDKATVPPAAAKPDLERNKDIVELLRSSELASEAAYYGKTYGPGAVAAGKELVSMYLKRYGEKSPNPIKPEEITKFLDSYETRTENGRAALTPKEKEGARELCWGAFSTMKGLILDKGLDSKYELQTVDGPVASKADPTKFSPIAVLGPKK